GFMLPVAVFLTCSVGDFEGTNDCRSERFLKAGSPGVPKGAIAAIGTATYDTNTCFNNCVDAGIFYGIFVDKIFNMGGALNRGKLNLYNSYPDNPYNAVYKFSYWNNLMGDPGMEIWTGIPEEMLVTYDSQVSIGVNYLEVTVENSYGYTLENAWVTALMGNDEIFSTGLTDSIGKILLPIDIENTGNVNLTVTKHNFIPHLGSFDIVQEDIFVNVFEIEIDDDDVGTSSGNGDGIINPGEDIELNVSLKNYGTQTANSVSAGISSESEFITITDETEHYGDIASGSSAYPSDDFDFSVSPDALGGVEIQLNIFIEDGSGNEWNDIIYLVVEGPNLYANNYSVIDGNNGILDQGETAELIVTIENVGTVSTNGINGILSCSDDRIIIEDSVGCFGTIPAGEQTSNTSNPFEVTANANVIPGSQYFLDLYLYNTDGYDNTSNFILEVGEVTVTDPLGPDEYGYYCYDDGDTDYDLAPEYSWIEIDPNYGGSGTVIPLYDNGDMGDIEDIDLPFVLRFYDYNYTTLTVCSNGWLTPGETEIRSFMNWHIPGPLGPSPIIAPFWDDLKIGNGNVCYYYDEVLHYFIIEWSHLQNDYDNSEETFQVILFDSNYYPTTTGNSEIFFQYKTINNVNQGNYGPYSNHGQYATVGIEDHTGTVGLEYTYNNQYPTAAKTLESEMALLFTGPPIPEEGPFLIYDSYEIDDSQGNNNGIVNPGETIAMSINLRNVGIETAFDVYATLSTIDPFVNITDSVKFFGNIDSSGTGTSIGYYIFGVATICPDQHDIIFDLSITSEGGYEWSSSFVVEVLSPDIATSSDILDFEEIYIGYPESMSLTVFNEGSDVLNITNIYSDNPDFTSDTTSFSLQDGESQDVMVTVNTSFVGMISGTLFIISNDPDEPEIYVSLLGLGVDLLPPDISVYPECISEDLFIGETSTQTLTIYNDGGSDLSFEIENTVNSIGGMATSFDGEDDYIEILDNPLLNLTTDLSFGGWIKTYSIYMNWQPIIVKGMMWTGHQDYYRSAYGLGIYNSQYWYDIYTSAGFGNIDRSVITVDIPDTDWHFIFGTFNNGLMKFYLDGSLTDTLNAVYSEINTNSGFLGIGREIPLHTNHFYGEMDEIRIYNVVLDEQEIQSTMNTSLNGNEPGLIGYWNFNGDNPWSDISGNGNDGIAHGNMTIVESTAPIIGWLSATPTSCTLPPDSSIDIEITFDATVLEVGNYEA
ncbi:MAG: choice-of-anchor D domain-containing protein, partial [Candidatus Cloacimonetes bacterium]|nr:choice-of-anchor D domain-containing protein [Candidatus Cloacimonadota bacterium]